MPLNDIATTVVGCIAVVGLLVGIFSWVFKRGADEREFAVALRDATEAIKELATEFRSFRGEIIDKFHQLDLRVTRLEVNPPPVHVTTKVEAPAYDYTSAHRDTGPIGGYPEG